MQFAFPFYKKLKKNNSCLVNCLKTNSTTINVTHTYMYVHLQHQRNTKN